VLLSSEPIRFLFKGLELQFDLLSTLMAHLILNNNKDMMIPVAMQSKACACSCLIAGVTALNPAEGMNVHLFCLLCVVMS